MAGGCERWRPGGRGHRRSWRTGRRSSRRSHRCSREADWLAKRAGEAVNPTEEDAYWREHHTSRAYFKSGRTYDDYRPAYAYGWESAGHYHGRKFEDVESDLSRGWDKARGSDPFRVG